MLSPHELAEIEQRHKAATPGPWHCVYSEDSGHMNAVEAAYLSGMRHSVALVGASDVDQQNCDAEFIAHAHSDVPNLLADLRELKAHIAEMDARVTFHDELVETAKQTMEKLIASEAAHKETVRLADAMAANLYKISREGQHYCGICGVGATYSDDGQTWTIEHDSDCPVAAYRAHVAGEG